MDLMLATTVKVLILAASGIALGIQRKRMARRHHESALALVSSPELRKIGCEWLCVPSSAAVGSPTRHADRSFKTERVDISNRRPQIREMKMVGEFRSSARNARSSSVAPAARKSNAGSVLMMSERALRVPVKMPLHKM
jgi:hypothetical protein